jgi:hypothetical protein
VVVHVLVGFLRLNYEIRLSLNLYNQTQTKQQKQTEAHSIQKKKKKKKKKTSLPPRTDVMAELTIINLRGMLNSGASQNFTISFEV